MAQLEASGVSAEAVADLRRELTAADPGTRAHLISYVQMLAGKEAAAAPEGDVATSNRAQPIDVARTRPPQVGPAASIATDAIAPARPEFDQPLETADLSSAVRRANVLTAPADTSLTPVTTSPSALTSLAPTPAQATGPVETLARQPAAVVPAVVRADSVLESAVAPVVPGDGSDDWQYHLDAAVEDLRRKTSDRPATVAEVNRHALLRLLYLLDGRRDKAMEPIVGAPPAQQDYWSNQLHSLATYMDVESNPDVIRRAAETNIHLRAAVDRLAEMAKLTVSGLTLCRQVIGYGNYEEFARDHVYQAGEEIRLYAEVENFKRKQTEDGYHLAMRVSYLILDKHGARVAGEEFGAAQETCRKPRRDVFVSYRIKLPDNIYGGTYQLQVLVEDMHSQKIGQSEVSFEVE